VKILTIHEVVYTSLAYRQPGQVNWSISYSIRRYSAFEARPTAWLLNVYSFEQASIVESSDDGIYSIDLDCIITSWNKGAEQLFGYTADEAVGRPVAMLIPLDRQDNEIAILERIKRGERICHYETVRQRKDGSLVEISLTVSPIYTAKGNIIGASKIARDISDRKKSQQLIVRELTHRTQNLFAVFQAIAARAVDESKTAAEIKYVLNGRLQALARAYQVMAEEGSASLAAILEREFSGFSRQVKFGGCDIVVNPSAAQQFALIIHELATNALKYGAVHDEYTASMSPITPSAAKRLIMAT
jgi:PAS domain S-box-containing protein